MTGRPDTHQQEPERAEHEDGQAAGRAKAVDARSDDSGDNHGDYPETQPEDKVHTAIPNNEGA